MVFSFIFCDIFHSFEFYYKIGLEVNMLLILNVCIDNKQWKTLQAFYSVSIYSFVNDQICYIELWS